MTKQLRGKEVIARLRSMGDVYEPGTEKYEAATHYARHPQGQNIGSCLCVVAPRTQDELSKILELINDTKLSDDKDGLSVVVQGGNTSTSRQSLPQGKQIVINMDHFKGTQYDPETGNISVGAGVTIDKAEELLSRHQRQLPVRVGVLGPNAKTSGLHGTTLAGMYMTNAAGPDAVHYGMAGDSVMECDVVMADGTVMKVGSDFQSDNTSLQLRRLLAGSNGTLGIVTNLKVRTVPKEVQTDTIALEPKSVEAITDIANRLELYHDLLSGLEYISAPTLRAYLQNGSDEFREKFYSMFPDYRLKHNPERPDHEGMEYKVPEHGIVLVKFALPRQGDEVKQALQHLDSDLTGSGLATKVVHGKAEDAWFVRRNIFFTNNSPDTSVIVMDIAVKRKDLIPFCEELTVALKEINPGLDMRYISHLGLNVLHPNIVIPNSVAQNYPGGPVALERKITQVAYGLVGKYHGVASAEHGMGPENMDYILTHMDPGLLREHLLLNEAHDPNGILNPNAKVSTANLRRAMENMGMEEKDLPDGLLAVLQEFEAGAAAGKRGRLQL